MNSTNRQIDPKRLQEALELLRELREASKNSKLTLEDAIEIGKEVNRRAWEKLMGRA